MSSGGHQLHPYYPPDTSCWKGLDGGGWNPDSFEFYNCSITSNMVNFLNLTGTNYTRYLNAYCLEPPKDDDCPFGFCPNPDVAGPLVRVASEWILTFGDLKLHY